MCSILSGIDWLIYSQLGNCRRAVAMPNGLNAKTAFFSMKAAELKCQNLIVKKVHVKWNIFRHFAKRSAQNSVCRPQN